MDKQAKILVRLPQTLKREIEREAKTENRSVSAQVLYMIKRALATKGNHDALAH